ncbi:hypothetical protein QR680_000911 [Steinernema hermaphroditum]|uniref:RanBP2-type domain-containing protein n=1 Tax=Steinernema hermaphroditum TaxID=289476 RepID=A0AA39GWB0_9BILA|nr:hypothetical protein QR680_000911 [Steinernema hermaphroditum]
MQVNLYTSLTILAVCCVLGESAIPVMGEALKTNQLLVVGVSGCRITFETPFSKWTCGMNLNGNTTISKSVCNWTSIVPLTEPYGSSTAPMKLLFFGYVDNKQVMFVRSLEFPKEKHPGHRFHSANVLDGAVDITLRSPEHVLKRVTNILYDGYNKLLYLIYAKSMMYYHMHVYSIDGIASVQPNRISQDAEKRTAISPTLGKMKWFSDPHSKKFFYFDASDKDGHSSIWSVSMDGFWALVQNKSGGVKEMGFPTKPSSISVSGGALIATYQTNSSDTQTIVPLSGLSEEIRCRHTNITPSTVFVVRDWEFCKLRDGERANATSCANENPWRRTPLPASSVSQEVQEETTFILLTSLIVVITTVVLVALVCVIAYKRRWWYEAVGKTEQIHAPYAQFAPDFSRFEFFPSCCEGRETCTSCRSCGKEKPRVGQEIGNNVAEKSNGLFSPQDWVCTKCNDVNLGRRNVCKAKKFAALKLEQAIAVVTWIVRTLNIYHEKQMMSLINLAVRIRASRDQAA